MAVVWFATRHGIALSTDSVLYLAGATHVADAGRYADWLGRPITAWPPLYSITLAVPIALGLDPRAGARLLAVLAMGAVVASVGLLTYRRTGAAPPTILAALLVAGFPTFHVSVFAWSEILFTLFLVNAFFLLDEAAETGGRIALAGGIVLSAAASMTRYAGIVLLVWGAAILLVSRRPAGVRLRDAAVLFGLGGIPLGVWVTRNSVVGTSLAGSRLEAGVPLSDQLRNTAWEGIAWVAPLPRSLQPVLELVFAAAVVALLGAAAWRFYRARSASDTGRAARTALRLFGFAALHTVWVVAVSMRTDIGEIGTRLLQPAYVSVAVGLVIGGHGLAARNVLTSRRLVAAAVVWVGATWGAVAVGALHTPEYLGYAAPEWRQSGLLQSLRADPITGPVYSNDPFALYLHTPVRARLSPLASAAADDACGLDAVAARRGSVRLVWFAGGMRATLEGLPALARRLDLRVERSARDGRVLTATRPLPARPPGDSATRGTDECFDAGAHARR